MLIIRSVIALQKLELLLQKSKVAIDTYKAQSKPKEEPELTQYQNGLTQLTEHQVNLVSYVKSITADYQYLINEADIFKLCMINRSSTDRLINDIKIFVHKENFTEKENYFLGVLDLVEKFLCHFLQVTLSLATKYIPAYQKMIAELKWVEGEESAWITEELTHLNKLLPTVIPKVELIAILKEKKLETLRDMIRTSVVMHWPDVLKKLSKLTVTKGLCEKLFKQAELASSFQIILDTAVQVKTFFNICVDLDVNLSQLINDTDWRLAVAAKRMIECGPDLFRHADIRHNAFKAWYEAHTSKVLSMDERQNYETGLVAIFTFEIADKGSEPDFTDYNSPIMKHREIQMRVREYDSSSSSSSSSGNIRVDSIIVRHPQTNVVAARVFKRSSDTLTLSNSNFEIKADNPKQQEMHEEEYREFLMSKDLKRSAATELLYLKQPNRNALWLFYHGVCSKFQSLFVAELSIATAKFQVAHNTNGYIGTILKIMGSALGPFGGFVFNALGETIQLISQRRTVMDAKKLQYLGRINEVCDVIERYARYLTLLFEIQIRLLQSVEFYEETTDTGILAYIRSFFSKTRDGLKSVKVTALNDSPQDMLADFVVANIFGNLILSEKMPNTPEDLETFLQDVMLDGPLSALDHDQKFFNLLGFFKFRIYHSDQKWHASDIFKSPRLAVRENDKIRFYKSPTEGPINYHSRPATIEEARKRKFILVGDEALTESQELRRQQN